MRIRPILLPMAAALLLVGCSSSASGSKTNFAKAINVPLSKYCLILQPSSVTGMLRSYSYPLSFPYGQVSVLTTAENASEWTAHTFGVFDALVKAGLLTSVDTPVKQPFSNKRVPAKVYSLTDAGRKALIRPDGLGFCAGHYEVVKVVNYTVAGKAVDGTTRSTANFTYRPADVPPWATSQAIKNEFPAFSKDLATRTAQPSNGIAELVMMSDGWQANISNIFMLQSFLQ